MKIVELATSIDPDEVAAAHYELPHLDLHGLPSCRLILNMILLTYNSI